MFFNGLSRTKESGELTSLPNPYQAENLAFSFQMEYEAEQYYPGFSRCIYLKATATTSISARDLFFSRLVRRRIRSRGEKCNGAVFGYPA